MRKITPNQNLTAVGGQPSAASPFGLGKVIPSQTFTSLRKVGSSRGGERLFPRKLQFTSPT